MRKSCCRPDTWLGSGLLRLAALVLAPSMLCGQSVHNAKRYGARGDGFTNDTKAVQAAIDGARHHGTGRVYFPSSSGCYMVSGLTFYSNLTYSGESQSVCLKMISSSAPLVTTPAAAPFSNATISYLTLDGNAGLFTGQDCLDLRGPTNVVIDHVTTTRCGEDGVYVTGWGSGPNPAGQGDGLVISNLSSSDNGRNGMSIIAGQNIFVRDSVFQRHTISAPFAGVDVEPNSAAQSVEHVTFENCTFRDNLYNGFSVWETHADRPNLNLRLIRCNFEGNGRDGAYIAASQHVISGLYVSGTMAANHSHNGYRGGLDTWNASDVVITNLSVTDASQALFLWGVSRATVANSTLSGSLYDLNTNHSTAVRVYASVWLAHNAKTGLFSSAAGVAPRIMTTTLPPPVVGSPYSIVLTAMGDSAVTWGQMCGSLPPGLVLSVTGRLAGTPSAGGIYSFTARARNAIAYDERTYAVAVMNPQAPAPSRRIPLPRTGPPPPVRTLVQSSFKLPY